MSTAVACIPEQSQRDCSDCQSKYVSLDVDYVLNSVDFEITPFSAIIDPIQFSFFETPSLRLADTPWEFNLPPPPFGKALLIRIQSFLC